MDIKEMISEEYCLRQLAEECSELAQAALKMIRAKQNETPETESSAVAKFIEEMADVELMMDIAREKLLTPGERVEITNIASAKADRFYGRLRYGYE